MDTKKKDILCQLNEIGVLLCKLNDEKKLKHCEKKINLLHQYLKKKKSKTMRKKSSVSKDTPIMIDDIDRSINMNNSSSHMYEPISEPTNTKFNSDLNLTEVSSIYPSVNDPSVNDLSVNQSSVDNFSVKNSSVKNPSVKFTSSIKPLNI